VQSDQRTLLLFGAGGAIGKGIAAHFSGLGWRVAASGRQERTAAPRGWLAYDPFAEQRDDATFDAAAPYRAVCWAQGANLNDSIYDVDAETHLELYRANCLFNIMTLKLLLQRELLAVPARLCVISSIWQNLARQSKLSYAVSKAALGAFVRSAAIDLGSAGHLINAVLPGALDTPMTRRNLSVEQMASLEAATKFGHLARLDDVTSLVEFLLSERNTGLTGQFIEVDLGYSHGRIV
jgi:3-oxoacyl-[acyl-carrier protein] reductase